MPRESDASIAAAMAPAKRTAQSNKPDLTGETGGEVGFGIPTESEQATHVVPIMTVDADQKTISNKNCLAKKVDIVGPEGNVLRHKFFVKVGIGGFVYDPWGARSEGTSTRYARTHGRPTWDWKEMDEEAFAYYLKYLKTRNRTWYSHVDRKLRNAQTTN